MPSIYRRIRKWVDDDLSNGIYVVNAPDREPFVAGLEDKPGLCLAVTLVPFLVGAGLEGFPARGVSSVTLYVSIAIGAPWLAFVTWRMTRVMRARNLKSARYFERSGRYALPPEYSEAEDVQLAKRRARLANRAARD